MALTASFRAAVERVRAAGTGSLGRALDDAVCRYLVAIVVRDLSLETYFPEFDTVDVPPLFSATGLLCSIPQGPDLFELLERLTSAEQEAGTYFLCLASLQKSRRKYEAILRNQPLPTMDQIGPRALLQFGTLSSHALAGLLLWRKWMFDIDNRAGQETGYLFEPIIAHAIGGTPFSSARSPVRRASDTTKGRQVDCIREGNAYEYNIRVTIAASGQGRWREELDFPVDCRTSGYVPVLVVLDPTANTKLDDLSKAFREAGGEVYVGSDAWHHLDSAAGPTMARFLELYVRVPIDAMIFECKGALPRIALTAEHGVIRIAVDEETYTIQRDSPSALDTSGDELPEEIDEETPAP
jgi:hypothetical protein